MALKTSASWALRERITSFRSRVDDPRKKHLVGGHYLSAEDLAEEVQRGSVLGRILSKILR